MYADSLPVIEDVHTSGAPLRLGRPIAFGADRVLLRRENEDGLVSLATHRLRVSTN
ncbi:MAG: hypothetical protein MUF00_21610 [Gemmatimonadaceae bacterium]|nr:hypothetical protein [Gemmatimonadaceae bacterium]